MCIHHHHHHNHHHHHHQVLLLLVEHRASIKSFQALRSPAITLTSFHVFPVSSYFILYCPSPCTPRPTLFVCIPEDSTLMLFSILLLFTYVYRVIENPRNPKFDVWYLLGIIAMQLNLYMNMLVWLYRRRAGTSTGNVTPRSLSRGFKIVRLTLWLCS